MAVSFDNTLLATGSCDKTIRVWSLKNTAPVAILHAHTGMITSLQVGAGVSVSYFISTSKSGLKAVGEKRKCQGHSSKTDVSTVHFVTSKKLVCLSKIQQSVK